MCKRCVAKSPTAADVTHEDSEDVVIDTDDARLAHWGNRWHTGATGGTLGQQVAAHTVCTSRKSCQEWQEGGCSMMEHVGYDL